MLRTHLWMSGVGVQCTLRKLAHAHDCQSPLGACNAADLIRYDPPVRVHNQENPLPQPLENPPMDLTRTAARFIRVVPLAFVTYSLAFLDRNNFGYAAKRMDVTLHLNQNISKLLPSLFFLGYFLFQIPSANYAAKRSVRWLVFWSLILWGLLSSLTGIIHSVPWLIVDRLALGAVEGVVLPAMLVFLTRWFTRGERSRANSLLMLGNPLTMMWASAASGFIIEHFERHPAFGMQGWQMMFIVEGLPSVLWAFFWLMLANDRPADAGWLLPEQAIAIQQKLDAEQAGIPAVKNYWAAFADRRVVLLSIMFVFFSAAGYAFMTWMPKIVEENTGRGIGMTGLFMAVPYLVACFSIVGVSWLSDRSLNRKAFVWGSHVVGTLGYLIAAAAGADHFGLAFAALIVVGSCTYTPTSPQWAWMSEMLPRNVLGESMALVNSAGALGGFAGVYVGGLINGHFAGPGPTFLFCAVCLGIAANLAMVIRSKPKEADGRGFEVIGTEVATGSSTCPTCRATVPALVNYCPKCGSAILVPSNVQ